MSWYERDRSVCVGLGKAAVTQVPVGSREIPLLLHPVMLGRMIFEFEDSEVAEVTQQGDALHIRFSAARLYDGERTGAGEGLWQPLLLICKRLAHANKEPEPVFTEILNAIGRVQRAQLVLEGQRLRSLPMPFASDGYFALELEFAGGLLCELKGQGLELRSLLSQCSVGSYQC